MVSDKQEQSKQGEQAGGRPFLTAFEQLIKCLPDRSQHIMRVRFGVDSDRPLTLEAIGKQYDITRERVRQIVSSSMKTILKHGDKNELNSSHKRIVEALDQRGGILPVGDVLDMLGLDDQNERGAVRFFLACNPDIRYIKESDRIIPSYTLASFEMSLWESTIESVVSILTKNKDVMTKEQLVNAITSNGVLDDSDKLFQFLKPSREIDVNSFEKWGLTSWESIRPRGVREKIFLILSEHGSPLHFRDIAEMIDQHNLGKQDRKTHPQTVHNELIKDNRFMLVGRGMYALAKWGYVPGTVKDVIIEIFKDHNNRPLSGDEIVGKVLEQRRVKPSTIMINLKTHFEQVSDDRFAIK